LGGDGCAGWGMGAPGGVGARREARPYRLRAGVCGPGAPGGAPLLAGVRFGRYHIDSFIPLGVPQ